ILTEYEKDIRPVKIQKVVGLDFAMDGLYVDSEQGEKANYPHYYRQALDKLAKAQRILSRRKKGSARWEKQRLKVAKLHEKTANQRRNFLHHKSKELAANYDPSSTVARQTNVPKTLIRQGFSGQKRHTYCVTSFLA